MSYLVLARKFRPQCFEEVVGQKAIVRTLQNALERDRVPHALIFSGVRGVGKTTLARIMAKALNCESGPSASPCNACRSCREIVSGASLDLHEVDGASNRGIQEIRELKEKIRFMPTGSRYKIFIIDEVHMLTTEAFNALLKTLEEPPDHVYFMLATTEMHRVPITILSRCQRYELKRVGQRELADHFLKLSTREEIAIAPAALNLIVREARGSVRDGLSLLDQVFSYCGKEVSEEEVVEVLGLVSHNLIAQLAVSLLKGDLAAALEQLDGVYNYGMNLKRFVNDLLSWFRALVVCKVSRNPGHILDLADDDFTVLLRTAADYSGETLSFMFNSLYESLEKVSFADRPRFALEMAFIQAVQVREVVPADEILHKLDTLLAGMPLEKKKSAESITPVGRSFEKSPIPKFQRDPEAGGGAGQKVSRGIKQEVNQAKSQPEPAQPQKKDSQVEKPKEKSSPESAPLDSPDRANGATAKPEKSPKKDVRQHWKGFVDYVRDRKPWMASALELAASVQLKEDELVIHYNNSVDCRMLRNRDKINPLTEFALDFFQESFKIRFESPDAGGNGEDSGNGPNPQLERQNLANAPLVLTALDVFTGQVGDIRVGPRFRKKMVDEESDPEEPGS